MEFIGLLKKKDGDERERRGCQKVGIERDKDMAFWKPLDFYLVTCPSST